MEIIPIIKGNVQRYSKHFKENVLELTSNL